MVGERLFLLDRVQGKPPERKPGERVIPGCRFLDLCGGGFRVRAVQVHGNFWASDPACYLTDEEVSAVELTA